jgi:glucose/arabinose dehydrogenase
MADDRGHGRRRGPGRGCAARRHRRRPLRTLVTGSVAAFCALTGPTASVGATTATPVTVTIASASLLAPRTIVNVAGSHGAGPSSATNTAMYVTGLARWDRTLYVADALENVIRAVDLRTGVQRIVAGTGARRAAGDGGPATAASFAGVNAMAVDPSGSLFVAGGIDPADASVSAIRRIGRDGIITSVPGAPIGATIVSLAANADGILFVGDANGFVHRMADGASTIVAGTATPDPADPSGEGRPATDAGLDGVWGLTIAPDGRLYVSTNRRLRRIDPDGTIHTVAAVAGTLDHKADGNIIVTSYNAVHLVAPDGFVTPLAATGDTVPGRIFSAATADAEDRPLIASAAISTREGYSRIQRLEPDGVVTTIAGTGTSTGGAGGPAGLSQLRANDIQAMPDGSLVVRNQNELWRITRNGTVSTLVPRDVLAPPELETSGPGDGGLTVDAHGTLYVVVGAVIRRVDPRGTTTFAGNGTYEVSGDGGPAIDAGLGPIGDIVAGPAGDLFISDDVDGVIRRVAPDGTISTIAGTARDRNDPAAYESARQTGDGGPARDATLTFPRALAIDHGGNLFFVDGPPLPPSTQTGAVRRIGTDGVITRVMAQKRDSNPIVSIAFDSADNLLFVTSDITLPDGQEPRCTCQILRRNAHGVVEVVAGRERAPLTSTGDGGPATQATLFASALSVDAADNVFLVDDSSTRIREIVAVGAPRDVVVAPPAAPVVAVAPFTG